MLFTIIATVAFRGFWSRIATPLALIFGFLLSWVLDKTLGEITAPTGDGEVTTHFRVDLSGVSDAAWFGLPTLDAPAFQLRFILLALPGVIALITENTGHVRAVAEMTDTDLDPYMGRALFADGFGTALSSSIGGSPTTTYAENIGVMAATRVYSTAAYYVAAIVAILLGLVPKFGAVVSATPGGVLGGITVVLYGMIGLLGAKIWIENKVNFANPVHLVPIAVGIIIGVGNVVMSFGDDFELSGIALGSIVAIAAYHLARLLAPHQLREPLIEDRADPAGRRSRPAPSSPRRARSRRFGRRSERLRRSFRVCQRVRNGPRSAAHCNSMIVLPSAIRPSSTIESACAK